MSAQSKSALTFAALVAGGVAVAVTAFVWTCCRVYVPEGYMAVVTTKTGDALPAGQILAEPGQKGVQRAVLAEGRHFLNPVNNDWKIVRAQTIGVGSVGIVTSKVGRELPPGDIIAPDKDSKGVWRAVLGPGTYRLNPEGYSVKVMSAVNIPIGYVGIVTSLTGKPAPENEFAAAGEKGVRKDVLQPGLYYINPIAYQVDVVEVGMNQVTIIGKSGSVVTTKSQVSNATAALDSLQQELLARQQAKREEYVTRNADAGMISQSAASSLNSGDSPVKMKSLVGSRGGRETKSQRAPAARGGMQTQPVQTSDSVAFGMNQFVQFPSSDGFAILLDMTVEFELMPEEISRIYMLYGDLPAVVSKIILPQILSISRMKGSSYKAREFIDGEGRQKFQSEMTAELVRVLGEKHILVRNAIVRHVEVPNDILAPIQAASEAKEQDLTNKTRQETAKRQAALNTEIAMVDQLRKQVEQETEKLVATTAANTRRLVDTIRTETELKVAELDLERARIEAKIAETEGEAEVKAKFMVENEEALGEQRKVKVFKNPSTLADLVFVDALNPDVRVRVIHAGEGTLWTDLKSPPAIAVPPAK